VHHWYK